MANAAAMAVTGRVPHRGHFTKRARTVSASHWVIRRFVDACSIERATREFVAQRAGYCWKDLYRWEAGETMPTVAGIESCFGVLGRVFSVSTIRGRRLEIVAGHGHWSARAVRQARRAAGLTQAELARRIRRHESTVQAWEVGRNAIPLDGFCAALAECGHRLVVRAAEALAETLERDVRHAG